MFAFLTDAKTVVLVAIRFPGCSMTIGCSCAT